MSYDNFTFPECIVKIQQRCYGLNDLRNIQCDDKQCLFNVQDSPNRFIIDKETNAEKYELLKNESSYKPGNSSIKFVTFGSYHYNTRNIALIRCYNFTCTVWDNSSGRPVNFTDEDSVRKIKNFLDASSQ